MEHALMGEVEGTTGVPAAALYRLLYRLLYCG